MAGPDLYMLCTMLYIVSPFLQKYRKTVKLVNPTKTLTVM